LPDDREAAAARVDGGGATLGFERQRRVLGFGRRGRTVQPDGGSLK
jgi:hypothetical protein